MNMLKVHRSPLAFAVLISTGAAALAQPLPPVPTAAPSAEALVNTTVAGRVVRWVPNPNGEVDGLLLDNGIQVGFDPTLSARLLDAVKLKDGVQVVGRSGRNPKVMRATQIKNVASGQTLSVELPGVDGPPARPLAPAPREALAPLSATGRIATLLYTDRGDANGALLDDGAAVRFPPHAGAEFATDLKVGNTLYARGYGTRGAQGVSFEATQIGTSESSARDVFRPPPPPDAAAPHARPAPAPR